VPAEHVDRVDELAVAHVDRPRHAPRSTDLRSSSPSSLRTELSERSTTAAIGNGSSASSSASQSSRSRSPACVPLWTTSTPA
jgi:hypothetical protein